MDRNDLLSCQFRDWEQYPSNSLNPALSSDGSSKAQELEKFKRRLDEEYLRYGDRNIPIQRGSLLFTPVVFAKLDFVIQLQSSPSTSTNEETLIQACHLLELYLEVQADDLLRGFHWQMEVIPSTIYLHMCFGTCTLDLAVQA